MNSANPKVKPSAAARAEAAAWIARLHGPNRTPDVEAGFRRWMAEDPERAAAFELLTDTWEKSARLRRRPIERMASWELPGFRLSFSRAAIATVAIAILAVIGTVFFLKNDALITRVGEQRMLTLEDGTRVYLNTDTRIAEHYDKQARRVELERGEALFEVAKKKNWPFIVTAGDKQVRAVGTAFVVRKDDAGLAVTLVEGKVTVSPVLAPTPNPKQQAQPPASKLETVTLAPGERLTFARASPPRVDKPALDRVTAWQRGQVSLDNTPLVDAVAEMNRYSRIRLVIEDPKVAAIQVSGIFRAGDSENFAQALARTYQLQAIDQRNEIVLTGRSDGSAHGAP